MSVTIIIDLAKAVLEQEQHRQARRQNEPVDVQRAPAPGDDRTGAADKGSPPDTPEPASNNDT